MSDFASAMSPRSAPVDRLLPRDPLELEPLVLVRPEAILVGRP